LRATNFINLKTSKDNDCSAKKGAKWHQLDSEEGWTGLRKTGNCPMELAGEGVRVMHSRVRIPKRWKR
jgi:hypothetical protein